MARSAVYNEWEDAGLAFSSEEVAGFDPKALAEKRIAYLLDVALVLERVSTIPKTSKPAFHHGAARSLVNRASWYCKALTLPGFDKTAAMTLPDSRAKDGKTLTAEAQKYIRQGPDVWLEGMLDNVEACLRYAVSLGRRAESRSGWTKTDRSLSNKLANALVQERSTVVKLMEDYSALPVDNSSVSEVDSKDSE